MVARAVVGDIVTAIAILGGVVLTNRRDFTLDEDVAVALGTCCQLLGVLDSCCHVVGVVLRATTFGFGSFAWCVGTGVGYVEWSGHILTARQCHGCHSHEKQ